MAKVLCRDSLSSRHNYSSESSTRYSLFPTFNLRTASTSLQTISWSIARSWHLTIRLPRIIWALLVPISFEISVAKHQNSGQHWASRQTRDDPSFARRSHHYFRPHVSHSNHSASSFSLCDLLSSPRGSEIGTPSVDVLTRCDFRRAFEHC